ncbi:hypothetical protein ABH911_003475 [Pseudomonas protegens]|uniref:DUF2806 domain-containing protein n=1 Tax=Pseudomonas protegens TaxID=380021 RepID=UPI003517F800
MSDGFSLIDLKGISKPITKLIDSVSKGIGAIYEPVSKVRNAKAEAKAMLILAEAQNAVGDVSSRALERVNYREIRRQNNIDSIVKGAVGVLPSQVSTEEVDEDWIVNFFDLAQDVGNAEMQKIWSKLLAGEVSKPGSYSPRTLNVVKSLTPKDAHMFTTLCGFSFLIKNGSYFDRVFPVFSYDTILFVRANGVSVAVETHLMNIGLLSSVNLWYGPNERGSKKVHLKYFSEEYYTVPDVEEEDDEFASLQAFSFTDVGEELFHISGAEPNAEFIKVLLRGSDLFVCP